MKSRKAAPTLPAEAFDRIPRLTLTLTDETIWLTRHDPRGLPATTYPVAPDEVGRAFNAFMSSTGLLPDNTLFWQSRGGCMRIGVWIPPARRTILFDNGRRTEPLNLALPGFVFVGEGTQYYVWAATARPAHESDELMHAPLPNIHRDGLICAGNVRFPVCAPGTMQQAIQLFFESHFNHDLSVNRIHESTGHESLLNVLRSLKKARRFPPGLLLPACPMSAVIRGNTDTGGDVWQPTPDTDDEVEEDDRIMNDIYSPGSDDDDEMGGDDE